MFDYIKKRFPALYDYYSHLQRVKKIREIEKIKQQPISYQMRILEELYEERIGHKLDWNNLQTYTEKMQWEKMFDKNPQKILLSDKFKVRDWVAEKIGEQYLIPLLGVWKNFDDIDFESLPNQFVLKTNHGSGTNYIVNDKSKFNINRAKLMFNDWMKIDYGYNTGFELHYSEIERRIIAERYLETQQKELQDYKFICFDGKPYFCWVDMGRYSHHTRNVYDLSWNLQPWNQENYEIYGEPIPCPKNFNKMIEIATILSENFHHVRVDLYNVDGEIYFGEMTFTNGSGLDRIIPEEYDLSLGKLWNVKTKINFGENNNV
ncbi:MAG: ATP-grasp fold amidoligase family protein [Clostridium sp.]|nr:ATP-grasp fold amidoligase family protein [Clostridium sp.]